MAEPVTEPLLSPTCVKSLVEAWLADLADQNKKSATIKHYRKRIHPFVVRFASREFGSIAPLETKAYMREVNRFPVGHKRAGELMANATRSSNAVVLELLESFALEVKAIPGKILPRLEKPISPRRDVVPTVDEVKAILAAAAPAARLIITALNQCGARPSELTGAKISDWHRDDREIVLADHKTVTKTGEPRRIGVGKRLEKTLSSAVGDRTDGFLFLNTQGKPWSTDSLAKYVNRIRTRLKIRPGVVPYGLRHKFLTKLCQVTSIEEAADAANHGSIKTTMQYVHKDKSKRADNQDLATDDDEAPTDQAKAA